MDHHSEAPEAAGDMDMGSDTQGAASIGDAANGQVLFNTVQPEAGFACLTCHQPDSTQRMVGPGLQGVSHHVAEHVPGQSAEEYLYNSIVDPSAYIVPEFLDRLMPRTYAQMFTEQEINDLVAYLMTL